MLSLEAQSAGEHRRAQHEQDIADDRAGDRGLDHVIKPVPQRGERDHQLCGITESGVEQPADAFARTRRQRLGRPSHPTRQRNDRHCSRTEYQTVCLRHQPVHG